MLHPVIEQQSWDMAVEFNTLVLFGKNGVYKWVSCFLGESVVSTEARYQGIFLCCEETNSWRRLLNEGPVGHRFLWLVTWIPMPCLVKQKPFSLFITSSDFMALWSPVCKCQHFFMHHLYCQDEDSKAGNCPGAGDPLHHSQCGQAGRTQHF